MRRFWKRADEVVVVLSEACRLEFNLDYNFRWEIAKVVSNLKCGTAAWIQQFRNPIFQFL